MVYGSVCSGIEAASVAWNKIGWEASWFSEIEKFPSRLLSERYPNIPNLGDMTKLLNHEQYTKTIIDLLVGGTPCQDFSVSGLRAGLDGDRGNLSLEFCRILLLKRPTWFVWENVPGVFSTHKGNDFAAILSGFRECGYSVAYRVLDSIHFGIPQRRRRVFVVGHIGNDWRPPAAVLFERETMRVNLAPSKRKRKETSEGTGRRVAAYGINSTAIGRKPQNGGNGLGIKEEEAPTLTKMDRHGVYSLELPAFFCRNQITSPENRSRLEPEICHTLTKNGTRGATLFKPVLRRLTPLECERLMGFPDNYTAIDCASDNQRYEVLGNSMPVNVMQWIGERINMVEEIKRSIIQ